jgi:hypothetical protein
MVRTYRFLAILRLELGRLSEQGMGVGDRSENLATDWSGYPGLAGWIEQLDLRGTSMKLVLVQKYDSQSD